MHDDDTLLAALKAGDEQAFETLVRLYGGRMLAVARRFVRNDDDAQDVVQAAYLSAFRSVGQFEGQCLVGTWLHRIVVNTALMKAGRGVASRRRRSTNCCLASRKTAITWSSSPSGARRPTS
jgi:RNA polymerase sigma factor (sigma-70 family)